MLLIHILLHLIVFKQIYDIAKYQEGIDIKKFDHFLNSLSHFEDFIAKDLSLNAEQYEFYGSTYLAQPNTQWPVVQS